MNRDCIEGGWKQLKGIVKERWGKLTHDDYLVICAWKEQRLGKIQRYKGVVARHTPLRDVPRHPVEKTLTST